MKKTIFTFLLIVILLPITVFSQGQQNGFIEGEKDATADVTGGMWIAVGCLTGGISYIYPSLFNPAVPQGKLVGKSPEFVAGYTDGYNSKRKSIMQKNSCYGGIVYWVGCGAFYLIMAASSAAAY